MNFRTSNQHGWKWKGDIMAENYSYPDTHEMFELYDVLEALLSKILLREVKGRYLGYFGSFTWAGAAVKRLAEFAEKSKFELVGDPVEMKQAMKDLTYTQCENLARAMADRLKKDR